MMLRISGILLLAGLFSCHSQEKHAPPKPPSFLICREEKDLTFRSFEEVKAALLDKLKMHQQDTGYHQFMSITDTVSWEEYQAEIILGHLFHPSMKSAVLGWSVSDTSMNIEVFDMPLDGQYTSILTASNLPSITNGFSSKSEFISLKDYNQDGWNDLEIIVQQNMGNIQMGHASRLWLINKKEFRAVRFFENIWSPKYDTLTNQIGSYYSGGCADMAMYFSVWKLESDSVRMTKEIDVDCCVGRDGNCVITVDKEKEIDVAPEKVYMHVPSIYKAWIKEKMSYNE